MRQRIHSLMNVLKGMAEVEILATDSKESYQDNRSFYRKRLEKETNPAIRALLEADCVHLDSVQTSMASARTFCLILRQRGEGGFCSLTDDQIQKYTAQFQEPEQFTGQEPELKPRMDIFFMEGL